MRYTSYISLAAALLFSACTFEQEDLFPVSASLRVQQTNEDIQNRLIGSEHGWLIQYFVAGTADYDFEGFNLFGRFYQSGKVTLAGNHRFLRNGQAGKYTEADSYYTMLAEEGSVLAFPSWNDVLTVFVDPVNPGAAPGSLVDDGEGMNGDVNLVNLSYDDDMMLFRGERHYAKVRFVRATKPWQEMMADIDATKALIANRKHLTYTVVDTEGTAAKRYFSALEPGYFNFCDRLVDPLENKVMSCAFTDRGMLLKDNIKMGEHEASEFVISDDGTKLVSVEGGIEAIPFWQDLIRTYTTGNFVNITDQGSCDAFAKLYREAGAKLTEQFPAQSLVGVTFGASNESAKNKRTGIVITATSGSKNYLIGYTATFDIDTEANTATIKVDVNDHSSNYDNYNKKGIGSYFDDLVASLSGTYTFNIDNTFNPTLSVWTKTDDPAFQISVWM